jgi:hypothetical protein
VRAVWQTQPLHCTLNCCFKRMRSTISNASPGAHSCHLLYYLLHCAFIAVPVAILQAAEKHSIPYFYHELADAG